MLILWLLTRQLHYRIERKKLHPNQFTLKPARIVFVCYTVYII